MDLYVILALFVAGAFLVGLYGERWRARRARKRWRVRHEGAKADILPIQKSRKWKATDASDQLRIVMNARFERRRLMSKDEAKVFYMAEDLVREQRLGWRVMAQVSLGEVLASQDPEAYRAINSKRVDILLVSARGDPVAAIEFQGGGHFQGQAPARDAVKREALRLAGIGYIEVTPEHDRAYLSGEIARAARRVKAGAQT